MRIPSRKMLGGTAIAVALAMLLSAAPALAHLAGGVDITVDGYILDFGFDPAPPVAGGSSTFAFNVVDAKSGEVPDVTAVWVRIDRDGHIAFAGTLRPVYGNVTMTLPLPDPGHYDVTARYDIGGKEVRGDFPLEVAAAPSASAATTAPADRPSDDGQRGLLLTLAAFAIAAAGVAAYVLRSRKRRRH